MKNILFLALLLLATSAYSQNEPIENARWVNGYYDLKPWGPIYRYELSSTTKYCTTTQDTLINSENYLQLFECSNAISYHGALRAAGPKWYFVAKDSASEMLLYDFSLEEGDSLKEPFFTEQYFGFNTFGWPLKVDLVDSVTIYGKTRKRITFNGNLTWVENVGCEGGLLWENFVNISNFQQNLECFSQGDSLQYTAPFATYQPDSLNTACPLNLSVEKTPHAIQIVEVYPNPAQNYLWVQWGALGGSYNAEVLSLDGRVLSTQLFTEAKAKLALNLAPGLYVLRLSSGQNTVSKMFEVI